MALFLANAYARGSLRARPKRCSDKAQFGVQQSRPTQNVHHDPVTIPSDKREGSRSSSDFWFFIRRPESILTLILHPPKSTLELRSCQAKNIIRKLHGNCD